jgi:hypothetical protein
MRLAACAIIVLAGTSHADPRGHEFIAEARELLVVGACAEGTPPPTVKPALLEAHCKVVHAAQHDYQERWLAVAEPFFATAVPRDIPTTVVYPFAGGDLSTALTVFPDALDITTLALEPAGDATALARIAEKDLKKALGLVEKELVSLYRSSYSVTMNMVDAMIVGDLPTQLIFSLSAMQLHGYEPVSVRYFDIGSDGTLAYVTDDDLAALAKVDDSLKRNRRLANVEIWFHKPHSPRLQVFRHISANLDDKHVKATPGVLAFLDHKGKVAAMTKAASYLLAFDEFSAMRRYVIDHVVWMVSDSTGLAPVYGTPEGFTYETWGTFDKSNMVEGREISRSWRAEYAGQPKRELAFRFGYPDIKNGNHLIIMRRAKQP